MIANIDVNSEFRCGDAVFRCTDVGRRTISAIRIDHVYVNGEAVMTRAEAEEQGYFMGPPYAVPERVFDERAMCSIVRI